MALIYGQLVRAQLENSASDLTPVATGLVYYNTTTGPKWYNGSAWLTAADLTSTQTFSGKAFTSGTIDSSVIGGSTPAAGTFTTATATTSVSAPVANITGTAGAGYINAAEQSSTPATPSSGFSRIYPKSDNKWYVLDDNGVESPLGSGAGGSGEKTYVTNPSGETDAAGWADSGGGLTVVRTTTASELPRENTTGTGLKIAAGGGIGVGDYVYYDFTLDDIDQNRKLNIKWAQKLLSTYAAGDLIVYIANQSSRATPLHTPLVSSIPGYDLDFDANGFDTTTTATLSLVIKNVSLSSGEGIVISDVIVGPGQIQAVPAIGVWTDMPSGTLGLFGSSNALEFTNYQINFARYQRVGNTMHGKAEVQFTGAPGTGTGAFCIVFKNGASFTVDSSIVGTSGRQNVGFGEFQIAAASGARAVQLNYTTVQQDGFSLTRASDYTSVGASAPAAVASGDKLFVEFWLPIAEWAGAPNYAGSNDVEYVSHDGTNIVYGPAGAALLTTTPAGTSEAFAITSGFSSIQTTDTFKIEIQPGGSGPWMSIPDQDIENLQYDGTNFIGLAVRQTGGAVQIIRGKYRRQAGSTSGTWAGITAGTRVRVVKAKAGAAVGFAKAQNGNLGLIVVDSETTTVSSTGHNPAASNINFYFERQGSWVTMTWDTFSVGATVGSGYFSFDTTTIPSRFRPSVANYFSIATLEGNIVKNGQLLINTDGSLRFGATAFDDTFNGTTANGVYRGSVTWRL